MNWIASLNITVFNDLQSNKAIWVSSLLMLEYERIQYMDCHRMQNYILILFRKIRIFIFLCFWGQSESFESMLLYPPVIA